MGDMGKIQAQIEIDCASNSFMLYNHIHIKELQPDRAVTELTVTKDNVNPYGIAHGGALYTMADCACGIAARSDGRRYVTISSSFNFLRSAPQGETVFAESQVRRRGCSTCYVDVDITDSQGQLLASGNFTFFRIE